MAIGKRPVDAPTFDLIGLDLTDFYSTDINCVTREI